jgi:hypothetical protein
MGAHNSLLHSKNKMAAASLNSTSGGLIELTVSSWCIDPKQFDTIGIQGTTWELFYN